MRVIIVQQRQRRNCALEIERFEQLKVRICEAVSCNASRTHALDWRVRPSCSYPICSPVPRVQSRL